MHLQRRSVLPGNGRARARSVVVRAGETKLKRSKVGFRYNPAQLRWERDDRFADMAVDDDVTMIQPKTGVAYQAWPVVHTVLKDAKLQTIGVEEAQKLQRQGWALVDVRLAADFERQHAEGAINVPMYRFVQGRGPWDQLKRLAMAAFAMQATERNTDFKDDLLAVVKKNQRVLLMCAIGGTLDTIVSYRREKRLYNDPERAFGRESRSLKAAYELLELGWSAGNVRHVDGGFQQWRFKGLPIEDDA